MENCEKELFCEDLVKNHDCLPNLSKTASIKFKPWYSHSRELEKSIDQVKFKSGHFGER